MPNSSIAAATGMSTTGIGQIVNSPLFQDSLARRRAEQVRVHKDAELLGVSRAKTLLDESAVDSVNILRRLQVESQDETVKLRAANSILDKALGSDAQSARPASGAGVVLITTDKLLLLQQVLDEDRDDPEVEPEVVVVSNSLPDDTQPASNTTPVEPLLDDTLITSSNG